jgi:hypothetical protein
MLFRNQPDCATVYIAILKKLLSQEIRIISIKIRWEPQPDFTGAVSTPRSSCPASRAHLLAPASVLWACEDVMSNGIGFCRPRLYVYDLPPRYREDAREALGMGSVPPSLPALPSMPAGVRLWHTAEVHYKSHLIICIDHTCIHYLMPTLLDRSLAVWIRRYIHGACEALPMPHYRR